MIQQINLYQSELRPRRVTLPATQMALLVGLAVLAMAALHAWTLLGLGPVRERALAAEQQLAAAEARVELMRRQFPPPVADGALTRQLENRQAALTQTRQIALRLRSGAYGSVDGLSGYLEGLARQHIEGTWLTAVSIVAGGTAVALKGKTLVPELVPAYLDRLSAEQLFSGKTFESLQLATVTDGIDEIQFSVSTAGIDMEAAP